MMSWLSGRVPSHPLPGVMVGYGFLIILLFIVRHPTGIKYGNRSIFVQSLVLRARLPLKWKQRLTAITDYERSAGSKG